MVVMYGVINHKLQKYELRQLPTHDRYQEDTMAVSLLRGCRMD